MECDIDFEDNAKVKPMANAVCQAMELNNNAAPVIINAVKPTCIPPKPNIGDLSFQSKDGCSSNPTRNNIITTPNSAKC